MWKAGSLVAFLALVSRQPDDWTARVDRDQLVGVWRLTTVEFCAAPDGCSEEPAQADILIEPSSTPDDKVTGARSGASQ